uniref:Uncharacterized protein n=1 Tax=Ditylenchus dipsaci TaxID=166011 RepID=A0A915EN95_9BILA
MSSAAANNTDLNNGNLRNRPSLGRMLCRAYCVQDCTHIFTYRPHAISFFYGLSELCVFISIACVVQKQWIIRFCYFFCIFPLCLLAGLVCKKVHWIAIYTLYNTVIVALPVALGLVCFLLYALLPEEGLEKLVQLPKDHKMLALLGVCIAVSMTGLTIIFASVGCFVRMAVEKILKQQFPNTTNSNTAEKAV